MRYNFHDLSQVVEKKIIQYSSGIPIEKVNMLIAYSGGVDSSVLLNIINSLSSKLRFKCDFVYINHSMNPKSKHILHFGKFFSDINNTNFIYHEIKKKPKKNKESFFREYRYNYFDYLKAKNNYNFILTAHHYNDQIETLYMKTRGRYDWTNLLAIREAKGCIRRPLLKIKKNALVNYGIKNGVFWIFDDTNNHNEIFRNNVRNLILPSRGFFFKIFLLLLNKYSKIKFKLFSKRIEALKSKIIASMDDFIVLEKKSFLKMNSNYKKLFLQSILKKYNKNNYLIIKNSKWCELWVYLRKNKNLKDFTISRNIFINNSKDLIIIKNKQLYNKKIDLAYDTIWGDYIFKIKEMNFSNQSALDKNSIYINKKIFKEGIFVRNWIFGDSYIDSKNNKKRVSKLFSKNKFNNYDKMKYPLVVDLNDKILWIPGLTNSFSKTHVPLNNNCIKISKEILN